MVEIRAIPAVHSIRKVLFYITMLIAESKKGSDSDVDRYNQKQVQSKEVISYEVEPKLESDINLYGKRKLDDSNLENKHEVK